MTIERTTQFAISLVNEPGKLAHICRALAKAGVNICALTVLETWGGNATIRVVVSDSARALTCFEDEGLTALETDVLVIEAANTPGVLAEIAEQLAASGINIDYAYVSIGEAAHRAWIVLRPSDIDEAEKILSQPRG